MKVISNRARGRESFSRGLLFLASADRSAPRFPDARHYDASRASRFFVITGRERARGASQCRSRSREKIHVCKRAGPRSSARASGRVKIARTAGAAHPLQGLDSGSGGAGPLASSVAIFVSRRRDARETRPILPASGATIGARRGHWPHARPEFFSDPGSAGERMLRGELAPRSGLWLYSGGEIFSGIYSGSRVLRDVGWIRCSASGWMRFVVNGFPKIGNLGVLWIREKLGCEKLFLFFPTSIICCWGQINMFYFLLRLEKHCSTGDRY